MEVVDLFLVGKALIVLAGGGIISECIGDWRGAELKGVIFFCIESIGCLSRGSRLVGTSAVRL